MELIRNSPEGRRKNLLTHCNAGSTRDRPGMARHWVVNSWLRTRPGLVEQGV